MLRQGELHRVASTDGTLGEPANRINSAGPEPSRGNEPLDFTILYQLTAHIFARLGVSILEEEVPQIPHEHPPFRPICVEILHEICAC